MSELGILFQLGFGLVLLWVLVYFGWRPYRIDKVRNDLFELRNELFICAAQGGLPFDSRAYLGLSNRINALIRFAHMISFSRVIIYQLAPNPKVRREGLEFTSALDRLPAASRNKAKEIHERMYKIMSVHMISGSPLLWVATLFFFPIFLVTFSTRSRRETPSIKLGKEFGVESIEEQVVLADKAVAQKREQDTNICQPAHA